MCAHGRPLHTLHTLHTPYFMRVYDIYTPAQTLAHPCTCLFMTNFKEKSINEFTKEMIEAFGLDQLAIRVTGPDGEVYKQSKNWIDEDQLIKMEKERLKNNERYKTGGAGSGYRRN